MLDVTRSLVYYHLNKESKNEIDSKELELENNIKEIFRKSHNNYGTRKIKVELKKLGFTASRRKIARIMRKYSLVSNYTVAQYKPSKTKCNEAEIENIVDRKFSDRKQLEVVVSDLTYVRVDNKWAYVCLLVDLNNREIVGYSAGWEKNADLVKEAFYNCKYPLSKIKLFHTDRGKEFDNVKVDEILETFEIERSLSNKGSPHDNAVAETTNKSMKIEFIYSNNFKHIEELRGKLALYVYWFNNQRIHAGMGYLTPMEYKEIFEYIDIREENRKAS